MNKLSKNFKESALDLIWLLDRGYPKKPAIDIIGNRYRLSHEERMILYRGIFDQKIASSRSKRRIDPSVSPPNMLLIDGYNVCITIFSYLRGMLVFRALDGYVRDTSELFGSFKMDSTARRSIDLLVSYLEGLGAIKDVCIYFDKPGKRSREKEKFLSYIENKVDRIQQSVVVRVVKSFDGVVKSESKPDSAVATSDTGIIEYVKKVVDIPDHIITTVFRGEILDLHRIVGFK